jgi:hypothetical protein
MKTKNKTASVLWSVGILQMTLCTIGLFIFGFQTTDSDTNFHLAIVWWVGSIVFGMVFIGLSQVIKLLQKIVDSKEKTTQN